MTLTPEKRKEIEVCLGRQMTTLEIREHELSEQLGSLNESQRQELKQLRKSIFELAIPNKTKAAEELPKQPEPILPLDIEIHLTPSATSHLIKQSAVLLELANWHESQDVRAGAMGYTDCARHHREQAELCRRWAEAVRDVDEDESDAIDLLKRVISDRGSKRAIVTADGVIEYVNE